MILLWPCLPLLLIWYILIIQGKEIEEVLKRLREPSNPRVPSESWNALKSLQTKLQQSSLVVSSRSAPPLSMADISPPLATLKNSVIAMPGLKNPVTIQTIENNVAVLPTKTKPKKLVFNGSDGKQWVLWLISIYILLCRCMLL